MFCCRGNRAKAPTWIIPGNQSGGEWGYFIRLFLNVFCRIFDTLGFCFYKIAVVLAAMSVAAPIARSFLVEVKVYSGCAITLRHPAIGVKFGEKSIGHFSEKTQFSCFIVLPIWGIAAFPHNVNNMLSS